MILGIHHAALAVPNLEEALAFYCGVIGFEVVMGLELIRHYQLSMLIQLR